MVELVVRLVFSLAVVLGMLMLLTRFSAKRFRGGSDALVRVVHRQPLSRTSAVAVVTVGSRVLVIGTTEHQVQLLTELDPEEIEVPAPASAPASVPALVPAPALAPVPAAAPVATKPAEVWELATLDELFEPRASHDVADASYAPRHAGATAADPARSFSRATAASRAADGALAGSILSAQTWKQAFAAATSRPRDAS